MLTDETFDVASEDAWVGEVNPSRDNVELLLPVSTIGVPVELLPDAAVLDKLESDIFDVVF